MIGSPRIFYERGDGHRPDSSWCRCDRLYDVSELIEVAISMCDSVDEGIAHIDDDTMTLDHITSDEFRDSCCDDDDICISRLFAKICSISIAARDGCSSIYEHETHGLTHDI